MLEQIASVCIYNKLSTEKLFSCHRIKGFSWLLVCSALARIHLLKRVSGLRGGSLVRVSRRRPRFTFIRYIGVDFTFGLPDCARYNEVFVTSRFLISRFCSIHFSSIRSPSVTLAGLKNVVRYTEDFVI